MYWFRRPPYLRWAAAALLVAGAAWLDLRPEPTALRPFAAVELPAGTVIEASQIEWRAVPPDLLPDPGELSGMVSRTVQAGEPLLASALTSGRVSAPDGWWTLETPLPQGAYPGQTVHLIVIPSEVGAAPYPVAGIVVAAAPEGDPLALGDLPGLVSVPAESATIAAAAVAEARVAVILGG